MDLFDMVARFSMRLLGADGQVIDDLGTRQSTGSDALRRAKNISESLDQLDVVADEDKNGAALVERDDGWDVHIHRPAYFELPATTETLQVRLVNQ